MTQFDLSEVDAGQLTQSRQAADYFEAALETAGNPKGVANWINVELSSYLNKEGMDIAQSKVGAQALGRIVRNIDEGVISGAGAKTLLSILWENPESEIDDIIEAHDLKQTTDTAYIEALVDEIMADEPEQVQRLKDGNHRLLGFFVGQVMKRSGGKADPKLASDIIRNRTGV